MCYQRVRWVLRVSQIRLLGIVSLANGQQDLRELQEIQRTFFDQRDIPSGHPFQFLKYFKPIGLVNQVSFFNEISRFQKP